VEKIKTSVEMLSSVIRMAAEKVNMDRTMGIQTFVTNFEKGKFLEKWSQRTREKIKVW
jgi:hypothetical protein